ncbi:hypothetical protein G5714_002878 [Onychostoma macrolepis]|uniref:Uncharacterized protein n=1 Tax=Onychostoma macrolepis TaxID=369639 RepID=A0A7J6D7W9_9TELE|nr:hypothetical protein G5714_002878 [Onychostoma macrolepis]
MKRHMTDPQIDHDAITANSSYLTKVHTPCRKISVEASGEIGCSSKIFEDVNNPCRESELRKSYEKLGLNAWPKCLQKIKGISKTRRGDPADEKNEKEIAERMIKRVFKKALIDMEKKKEAMKTLFNLSDSAVHNKKQLQCMEMAVQNLQRLILYEKFTHYQDINKELGNNHPGYLCELADDCYKQGCLMALHDPPLILDWNKKKDHCGCPFPPIKLGEGHDGESI